MNNFKTDQFDGTQAGITTPGQSGPRNNEDGFGFFCLMAYQLSWII